MFNACKPFTADALKCFGGFLVTFPADLYGVQKRRLLKKAKGFLLAVFSLLCFPDSIQALGIGVPVLKSHLNEVLDVRIPLLLAEGESLNSMFIEFAKPNEYRLVGLEPYTDLSSMRISVEHMQDGELYVQLSSVAVVQTPIVSVLLKARIGHNTYYKQIQVLLDTMGLGARAHAIAYAEKSRPILADASSVKPISDTEQGWARTWRYGPVRSGDSLSTIAYRLRKDKQWSNHDVMLALYRFNPDAFIQHDMNRLKSGGWLDIPRSKALKELLKRAPEAYEKLERKAGPLSKKLVKPTIKSEITLPKQDDATAQLRYVGRIALGSDAHVEPSSESETSSSKGSERLEQQLNQLYQQAMDDHLQMAGLDQSLMVIRDDIGQLGDDILALKEQQNMLQQQIASSPSTQYWMQGFLLLCLLNIILIGVFLYHRYYVKKEKKYDIEEVSFKKETVAAESIEEPIIPPAEKRVYKKHLLENKMYDIENYLNLRDYGAVEDILKQMNQTEDDHFGVCALKARLYHETGRLDDRDALIRHKHMSLSDQQWHLLCDRLPINLWHALHESGVINGNGALVNVEEGLTNHQGGGEVIEIGASAAEQVSLTELQSDTVDMDISQLAGVLDKGKDACPSVSLVENTDINSDFLKLDDNEFKGVDEQLSSWSEGDAPEEEFISTVCVTTVGRKKKLL